MKSYATQTAPATQSDQSSDAPKLSNGMSVQNPLDAYLNGQSVRPVERVVKTGDRLTAFFSKYVRGATTGAEQGWTGPMIGRMLCTLGYINIVNPQSKQVVNAGTEISQIPDHDALYAAGALLEEVKRLPTRAEFWQLVGQIRRSNK